MAIINVTIGSKLRGHTVPVDAGDDIITICQVTALLSATLGVPARGGDTFVWEQVLQHQYTNINRTNNTITAVGDITISFSSSREIISVFIGFDSVVVLSVSSYVYNGTNTILTIVDPIPTSIPITGVFEHAGNMTDSTFTWDSPRDELDIIISPNTFTNKQFRFWSNRGQRTQQFDDVKLILTPEDVQPEMSGQLADFQSSTANPCRTPVSFVSLPAPYSPNVCTSGDQLTHLTDDWTATWVAPTCDILDLVGYIAQQTCDGGDNWTTVGTTTHIREFPIPPGCSFRVLAAYAVRGMIPPSLTDALRSTSSFVLVPSNISSALTGFNPTTTLFPTAYDTVCTTLSARPNSNPITAHQVSGVIILNYNTDGVLDDDASWMTSHGQVLTYNPITAHQVSGNVTIGG